ncbi:hypothetical protein C8F04DRAFT_1267909 [Mycena alexandri]|uniref:ATP synthase protein MI25 n=1 Tax=Mycena alexandri TaxID=1745969 RepID=A0AAD6WVS9_9AGAR|nr:hypothetical protein C8F04DRAFT_1267909 [Mycena alexandri]
MPDLVLQLLPLALAPLAALVPNGVQRGIIFTAAGLYFGGFVVLPNLPSAKMKNLERSIEDTVQIHATAVRELEKNPRFVTELSLRLVQLKFAESTIRSKILTSKDIAWRGYVQHLRGLSVHISECERDARDIRTVALMALECNRQTRYAEDIAQKRTILDTAFLNPMHNLAYDV